MKELPRTFVLIAADASTSMLGVIKGARRGVNAYLADLAADPGRAYLVSIAVFAEKVHQLCSAVPVGQAPELDEDNYRAGGDTSLLDAIGSTLTRFDAEVQLRDSDRVLFLLATDGIDNCSHVFSPGDVLEMVNERERDGRWAFIHLAAGPQAAEESLRLGLRHVIEIAQQDLASEAMYHSASATTRAWASRTADFDQAITRELSLPWAGSGHGEARAVAAMLADTPTESTL